MNAADNQSDGGATETKPRALRPRDAATLVILDHSTGEARILMGRRRPDLVFMPNKYVFPGGRVDRSDRLAPCLDDLDAAEERKLLVDMKGTPSRDRARALALAAVRETFEEAGLLIGSPIESASKPAAAERTSPSWQRFLDHGMRPRIGTLRLFARAITPPGRKRRYDTRFFTISATEIALRVAPPDNELKSLDWFSLDEARSLDLPSITRAVIEDLSDRLTTRESPVAQPVPFYYFRNGSFHRALISA
ncbi:MAG: NUDIX hydrolase [Hyphomicrobium sp.]|nr:MAG: NUDIX hydrolase [Hyphomicrobium sp.]